MNKNNYYSSAAKHFHKHYKQRLTRTKLATTQPFKDCTALVVHSKDLKDGNEPRLYLHSKPVKQVLVLSHGLSDSPHYVTAIAQRFFKAGVNVILPLLPAHGLKDPDKAMEDYKLDAKWRYELDVMVELAKQLGEVISIAGFSAGGALSYNKILRDEDQINGGLFLFASAIDVRLANEIARLKFLSGLVKIADGKVEGYGRNPYKYPKLPTFGAFELGEIINQNISLSKRRKIKQPVFAAHSIHDNTAKLSAVVKLLKSHIQVGVLYTVSQKVLHGDLPLAKDTPVSSEHTDGTVGYANPEFDLMMKACMEFYKKYVAIGK